MDLYATIRFYIEKMLREVRGMKALILDADTTYIVSMVYSQSEILEHEVFLVEKLDTTSGEQLPHLAARPRHSSSRLQSQELADLKGCPAGRLLPAANSGKHRSAQEGVAGTTLQRVSPLYGPVALLPSDPKAFKGESRNILWSAQSLQIG